MDTTQAGRHRIGREQRGPTNRRSLLTLVTLGIAASLSQPARAHRVGETPDTEPATSPPHLSNSANPGAFLDLKKAGAEHQVRAIRYIGGSYRVATADGNGFDFPESDLRFKVDSSAIGPFAGKPVIMPAGQVGDGAWVFFASPDEISAFIKPES